MCPIKTYRGFTLIELLVTLTLAGLLIGTVSPALNRMLESWQNKIAMEKVVSMLRSLPLEAVNSGQKQLIKDGSDVDIGNTVIKVIEPVVVLKNGFCKGGKLILERNQSVYQLDVVAPYCEVFINNEQA